MATSPAIEYKTTALKAGDVIAVNMDGGGLFGKALNYNNYSESGASMNKLTKYNAPTEFVSGVSYSLTADWDPTKRLYGGGSIYTHWRYTLKDPYYVDGAQDYFRVQNYGGVTSATMKFQGLDDSMSYNLRVYSLIDNDTQLTVTTKGGTMLTNDLTDKQRYTKSTLEEAGLVFEALQTDGSGESGI